MDLSKVLSLYYEGQAYVKRCNDFCHENTGAVAINPYYGYIILTPEAFKDLVKDVDSVKTEKMKRSGMYSHEATVNGVCFSCLTEGEDLYGD